MATELFSEYYQWNVSTGGTDAPSPGTVETLTITNPAGAPPAQTGVSQFRIVDMTDVRTPPEIILVTNVNGGVWTAIRGAEGGAPWAHSPTWTAVPVLTAAAVASLAQGGSGAIPFNDLSGQLRAQMVTITGDLWMLSNAYWDPVQQNFYRIDITHPAFGWQVQGQGFIPGEPDLGYYVAGATLWVAQPASYTLIRNGGVASNPIFAGTGGWELGHVLTSQRQFTIGGGGIEMDGYGTFPFGRVLNNTTGTVLARHLVGMVRNAYTALDGYDDPTQESWYWGYVDSYNPAGGGPPYATLPGTSHWAITYLPPNTSPSSGVFNELMTVKPDGEVLVTINPTANLGVATKQYVDGRVRGGEAFFSGTGSQAAFFVAHGLGAVPSRVHLTALNQASLNCWYTKDATNVGINYATAPANGATIAVAWSAYP